MSDQQLPLDIAPNQKWQTTLRVDGASLTLNIRMYFNEMAQCWVMDISDITNAPILTSVPLLTGLWPAANLLCQQGYLLIGASYILDISNIPSDQDYPNARNLGTEYIMIWGDTA